MTGAIRRGGWVGETNAALERGWSIGLKVLDLFCGAGGLSLGFLACGFEVFGIDRSPDAVETFTRNAGEAECVELGDEFAVPNADVIVAGPPCQPWSRAGKRLGELDKRDGLSVVAQAAQEIRPVAVVIENVPDLARQGRRQHLDDFMAQLSRLGYTVAEHTLNAADFGVPQNRHRVFVTGVLGSSPLPAPEPYRRLITVQQAIPRTCRRHMDETRVISDSMQAYIGRYERASGCRTPRDLHLDRPARTLTVRNLSGATGDMMRLRLPDGQRRTLTTHEAARLQSFPDWYRFQGSTGANSSKSATQFRLCLRKPWLVPYVSMLKVPIAENGLRVSLFQRHRVRRRARRCAPIADVIRDRRYYCDRRSIAEAGDSASICELTPKIAVCALTSFSQDDVLQCSLMAASGIHVPCMARNRAPTHRTGSRSSREMFSAIGRIRRRCDVQVGLWCASGSTRTSRTPYPRSKLL